MYFHRKPNSTDQRHPFAFLRFFSNMRERAVAKVVCLIHCAQGGISLGFLEKDSAMENLKHQKIGDKMK